MRTSPLSHWGILSWQAAGLWALAVAQPVLEILGRAPEFFVIHHADPLDILAFMGLVVFAPPIALAMVIGVAAAFGRRAADGVTLVIVGALCALVAVQIGYRLGAETWLTSGAIGAVAALVGGAAWMRLRAVRVGLNVLASAVVIVPLAFLLTGGIRSLMRMSAVQVAERTDSRLPPVVLVIFDELPLVTLLDQDNRIDPKRYPNFASLAAEGIWFRNTTTVSDYTRYALPAILTGRFPRDGSVPTPGDHPNTLFTLLASSHRMEVLEPLTSLCPAQLCGKARDPFWTRQASIFADVRIVTQHLLLPPAARVGLPDVTQGWGQFDTDKVAEFRVLWRQGEGVDHRAAAMAFIDGITKDDTQPTLYFMHTMASHHPPRWLPSGQAILDFREPPAINEMAWATDSWPVAQYQQGHLLQAGFADLLIGHLQTRLRELGLYDRALVVVAADHGFSFKPGARIRDFTPETAGEILPVPLIVKLPSDRQLLPPGTIDDRNVETIDIVPLIAEALGIALPWPVDGTSPLHSGPARAEKRIAFHGAAETRSFTPADVARRRDDEVRRKIATFGTGAWPTPTPGRLEPLVGRRLDSFVLDEPGPVRAEILNLFSLEHVDLNGPAVPALVKGQAGRRRGMAGQPVYLALALRGEVVATTRTWPGTPEWMALIPVDRLRNGRNDVELFLVDPALPGHLTRTHPARPVPPGENLLFGERARVVATYEGFYRTEQAGTTPFHWTDGNAAIRVPTNPASPPTQMTVDILFTGQDGTRLQILLDDCELLVDSLPAGAWSRTIDLRGCQLPGPWTTIRFVSGSRRLERGDTRRLGLALANVALR